MYITESKVKEKVIICYYMLDGENGIMNSQKKHFLRIVKQGTLRWARSTR